MVWKSIPMFSESLIFTIKSISTIYEWFCHSTACSKWFLVFSVWKVCASNLLFLQVRCCCFHVVASHIINPSHLRGGSTFSTLKSTQQKCLSIETKVCRWYSLSTLIKVKTPAVWRLWDARMVVIWSQNGANCHYPTLGNQFHLFPAMQNYPYL